MVILITGATHSGKTLLAQKLLEKYHYPYLSLDHLKMGLIRSHQTELTPLNSDEELTSYLWPIVLEIIKTAIENNQNLIIEGCYIPMDWQRYFDSKYLNNLKFVCLIMSQKYLEEHFKEIKEYANVIEQRIEDDYLKIDNLIKDNQRLLKLAQENQVNYLLIDDQYNVNSEIIE